jgi:cobaltochelatase CobT
MTVREAPLTSFKQAIAIVIKAIGHRRELEVAFTLEPSNVSGARVKMPAIDAATEPLFARGNADAVALSLRYHNVKLHHKFSPENPREKALFDVLEEARYEALGAREMAGVAHNLLALAEKREGEENPLHLIALEKFVGKARPYSPPPRGEGLGEGGAPHDEMWKCTQDYLHRLSSLLSDQAAYAEEALKLIAAMENEPAKTEETNNKPEKDDQSRPKEKPVEDEEKKEEEAQKKKSAVAEADAAGSEGTEEVEGEREGQQPSQGADNETLDDAVPRTTYRAFTTAYDEIVPAEKLCPPMELAHLRSLLDRQVTQKEGVIVRLANRLQRLLQAKQTRAWEFDLEEGLLDAARLTRVILDPLQPLSFKVEKDTAFRDTVVTLLLDNSGSMRGRPISLTAISADILARTLERCGVKVEILGFTTKAWKGGRAHADWIKVGQPPRPGRVNDLRHIIYKAADTPWRRARKNLGLLLREGLLKENIDGEALLWAYSRLKRRPEQRRILVVVSDGAPVDDATQAVNPANYLEQHLRSVIDWLESRPDIQLVAIGIGHDVTRYYRRAVTLTDAEQLGSVLMEQLADLFEIE